MKKVTSMTFSVLLVIMAMATLTPEVRSQSEVSAGIQTTDHFVPHISTIPANKGQPVKLFVRERVLAGSGRNRPAVLMVHGATQSTLPAFDLRFGNYSWMAFLARVGMDVFAVDLQGYGLSTRPMMDQPCNVPREQQTLLVPKPLSAPCDSTYPYRLTTSQSEWDEIDTVVNFIRQLRGVKKVSLIGWSQGGTRVGGYAARNQEKVDKLFLYAPGYLRNEPSDPPASLPERGAPMVVRTVASFIATWDRQVRCESQFNPAIRDAIRSAILQSDQVGSTWGNEAMWRAPVPNTLWGWNPTSVRQIRTPTLIIRGDLDAQIPEAMTRELYEDLGIDHKVLVRVECAAHQLLWENRHMILLRASREWLLNGTFAGHRNGSFLVDAMGKYHRVQ